MVEKECYPKITTLDLAEEFFEERFKKKPKDDPSYFEDWERRFYSGKPEGVMDSESKEAYIRVLRKHICGPFTGFFPRKHLRRD